MAGRPLGFDRDEALLVAQHAFWRAGFRATSVAALTQAMGINPPSLYAAFGDKQRLFDEAAGRYVARFRAGTDAALDAPTAREALADLLRIAAHAHTDPVTPAGCLVLTEPQLAGEREWLRRAMAERIARGRADGDVPADTDPDRLAGFLETVLIGMSARARDGADRAELDAVVDQTIAGLPPSVGRTDRPRTAEPGA